jgi:hypothetical protein
MDKSQKILIKTYISSPEKLTTIPGKNDSRKIPIPSFVEKENSVTYSPDISRKAKITNVSE